MYLGGPTTERVHNNARALKKTKTILFKFSFTRIIYYSLVWHALLKNMVNFKQWDTKLYKGSYGILNNDRMFLYSGMIVDVKMHDKIWNLCWIVSTLCAMYLFVLLQMCTHVQYSSLNFLMIYWLGHGWLELGQQHWFIFICRPVMGLCPFCSDFCLCELTARLWWLSG